MATATEHDVHITVEDRRRLHTQVTAYRLEMGNLARAGMDDSPRAAELRTLIDGMRAAIRAAEQADSERQSAERRQQDDARAVQDRRQREHDAEVKRAVAWLRGELADGPRIRDDLLRAACSAGFAEWREDDSMPASRPGRFVAPALLDAAHEIGALQHYGERGAIMWAVGFVHFGTRTETPALN